jgi:hypothetical protein
MADWTAITGIVVSGVVGPSVVAFWAWRIQASRSSHEIALADRAAARVLVDRAAEAVQEACGHAGAVRGAAITWGNKLGVDGGGEQLEAFKVASRAVDLLEPRVAIMFGRDSDVSKTYAECLVQLKRIASGANMMSGAHEVIDVLPYWQDIDHGHDAVNAANERFVAAAHAAIGVD